MCVSSRQVDRGALPRAVPSAQRKAESPRGCCQSALGGKFLPEPSWISYSLSMEQALLPLPRLPMPPEVPEPCPAPACSQLRDFPE